MNKAYYCCLPSNIQRVFVTLETTYSLRACHDLERIRVHATLRPVYLCVCVGEILLLMTQQYKYYKCI